MLANNIKTVDTRHGKMSFHADDEYIGHALERYGEYSRGEVDLWSKIIKPGNVAVDVGANIGVFSLALAGLVGQDGCVYAFEPQPENFRLLERNVKQNKTGRRIVACDYAMGSGITDALFVRPLGGLGHNNYGRVELGDDGGGSEVVVRTLDSCIHRQVHFIKIDVEGMEAEVIRGAAGIIKLYRPILYVENDRPAKSAELTALLRGLDYRLYEHVPPIYAPDNFNKADISGERPVVSLNVLAVPAERASEMRDVTAPLKLIVPAAPRAGKSGWAGIVRLGGVGDDLIAASVLRPLKEAGYKVDVITQEPQHVVFENNPFVDKLSVKNWQRDLPNNDPAAWNKYFRSRSYEYDLFVNLSYSCEGLLAHFQNSVPFHWPQKWLRQLCDRSYLEVVHDIVGVPHAFGPLYFPTDEEKEQALATRAAIGRKKIVAWCITGSRVDKIYPQSSLAIARMIRELGVAVVMLGAPLPAKDFEMAKEIQEWVRKQNGDDAGLYLGISPMVLAAGMAQPVSSDTWPIRRVLAMAQACDLVIGPDTGPMWAVALESVPKIMLHSHASVTNITKHWINTASLHADPAVVKCWPCHCLHDTADTCKEMQAAAGVAVDQGLPGAACISSISVERVVRTAARLLGA